MTIEEIKAMSITDLTDLLSQNTQTINYDPDSILSGYSFVFAQYLNHKNFILEEKQLWDVILIGFFKFEDDIISAIEEKIGWYTLMAWCYTNLKKHAEIKHYFDRYYEYHKEKVSTAEVLTSFIGTFIDDLGTMDLEALKEYASNLGQELNKLPEMVKKEIR